MLLARGLMPHTPQLAGSTQAPSAPHARSLIMTSRVLPVVFAAALSVACDSTEPNERVCETRVVPDTTVIVNGVLAEHVSMEIRDCRVRR